MHNFITGGRGFIGAQLALTLADRGEEVTILNRAGSEVPSFLSENPGISIVEGDILNPESLRSALKGCDAVYHLAALAKPWSKRKRDFHDVNVTGTLNVLEAARNEGIERAVVTSSAGTFGPQENARELVHENKPRHRDHFTEYERTKALSMYAAMDRFRDYMTIRFVSPSRVFGPGALTVSNAVTKLIIKYWKGKFRFLPGDGNSIGNYAFIEDVVNGHISAMERGEYGQDYILGGHNLTYREFFDKIGEVRGKKHRMYRIPVPVIVGTSHVITGIAEVTGIPPALSPSFAKKYMHDWGLDLSKAREELNYTVTPVEEALEKTINYLKTRGLLD